MDILDKIDEHLYFTEPMSDEDIKTFDTLMEMSDDDFVNEIAAVAGAIMDTKVASKNIKKLRDKAQAERDKCKRKCIRQKGSKKDGCIQKCKSVITQKFKEKVVQLRDKIKSKVGK